MWGDFLVTIFVCFCAWLAYKGKDESREGDFKSPDDFMDEHVESLGIGDADKTNPS